MTLLVRHAESEWNLHFGPSRIDMGLHDPPLTPAGRDQAEAAVDGLRGEELTRIVASPYRRALQTATIFAGALQLPISIDPDVRERCAFSCDQGSAPEILAREWPELDFAGLDPLWWGGAIESNDSLLQRCERFRSRMRERADAERTLVVTHWGFIRALTGAELHNAQTIRLDLSST